MTLFARLKARRGETSGEAVRLLAPLSGFVVRIEAVPDEAFAKGVLGDGIAIDPTSARLLAPCDGAIIAVAQARHAVTLRAANGAEILMHIGVDTMTLGGEGFKTLASEGARVKAGDPLIEFDMDLAARKAKSLVSPIIILNEFAVVRRTEAEDVAAGDFLMEIGESAARAPIAAERAGEEAQGTAVIRLAHGIHARPAAEIAARAKSFSAAIEIRAGERRANARSVSSLMALGARFGDEVSIAAAGDRALAALEAVRGVLTAGAEDPRPAARVPPKPARAPQPIAGPMALVGVAAAPGLGVGAAILIGGVDADVEEDGRSVREERQALEGALAALRKRLLATGEQKPGADILAAHAGLLDDPELAAAANRLVDAGRSAAFAWRSVMREQASLLRNMDDARMAERAADFIDLERQVLALMRGEEGGDAFPEGAVLIADELYPSQLLSLDAKCVAGICTAQGGPTSHASILAASFGIPTVVALGPLALSVKPGSTVIVDAGKAEVLINPDEAAVQSARERKEKKERLRALAVSSAADACRTADGVRIEVLANLASVADAKSAVMNFAEGCGLLRTEFLFLDRASPPSEAEQAAQYQAVADALGNHPLTIRTLDAGADKCVPYLQLGKEENPALGIRGVRASLKRPDILESQLRAILKVTANAKIMVPMIASLKELRAVRALLDEIIRSFPDRERIPLGVMVETPAAAILADQIAAEADFLSIGSNDLAQYVLAMDRGNPLVASDIDALNPAVLRLIGMTGEAGARYEKPVSVCGGLASDLSAAPLLIGLGVSALSATPARIPEIKAFIRTVTIAECKIGAARALDLESAAAVRAFVREAWPQLSDLT